MTHHGHDAFRALDMYDTDDLRAVSQRLKKAGSHNYGDTAVAMALDTYLMGRDESRCKADVGPLDLEAIESRAQRLMIATWECDKLSYTDQWQLTNCDVPALVAEVRRLHAELDAANKRIKELEEEVADKEYAEMFTRRGLEAKLSFQKNLAEKRVEIIEQLNRRIQELEDGAAKANELIHLYKNQRDENEREAQECGDVCLALEDKLARAYDVMSGGRISKPETDFETVYAVYQSEVLDELTRLESEVAEHRRHVATVMQREDALKKRVEELEDERDDAKEQATSLASLARVSEALAAKRAETIAVQQQHIEVLNRQLAERDADAEVGRAVRYLRCKPGHSCVTFHLRVYPGQDMHPPQCWISWARDMGGSGSTRYGTIQGVIDTYYEGKD